MDGLELPVEEVPDAESDPSLICPEENVESMDADRPEVST